MTISQKGIDLIKKFEGCRLEAYQDVAGIWTVGWGNTRYEDNSPVKEGDEITQERADSLLLIKAHSFAVDVDLLIKSKVNQNQFDSLVSFAYNVGIGNFKKSTLLKKINKSPSNPTIINEFLKWTKATINGKLVEVEGLKNRRMAELNNYIQ